MRIGKTLRTRFAFWVAALLLLTLVTVGLLVYLAMSHNLAAAIDNELRLSALQAADAADIEKDGGELEMFNGVAVPDALDSLEERGLTIRLLGSDGVLLDSLGALHQLPIHNADLAAAKQGEAVFRTLTSHGQQIRMYTIAVVDGKRSGIVQTAQPLTDMQQTLDQLLLALGITVPIIVLIAGGGGYLLAARALAPIASITRTAQRISAEDLHARLNVPHSGDEVGELAQTFDGMIARLEDAFQRERQFTSDASHELRTPLTAMQLILSVTRAEPRSPEVYEQALDDLAEETARLRSIVEDLLALARGTGNWQIAVETMDLATLLLDVSDTLRPLADDKDLTLTCTTPDSLEIVADSDALARLFINLIDNAVKYTEQGSVEVCAHADHAFAVVTIRDSGSGIAEQHLPHLFDRFYQVDTSRRSRGTGLGLAIAKEIVEAHGGTISVQSALGAGSTFTVRLPCQNTLQT